MTKNSDFAFKIDSNFAPLAYQCNICSYPFFVFKSPSLSPISVPSSLKSKPLKELAYQHNSVMSILLFFLLIPVILGQTLTSDTGHAIGSNQHSQSFMPSGPLLLQDASTLMKLRRFNTERIPERVVHGRGIGIHGVFTSAKNHSELCAAAFLGGKGIETEVFVRFSTVIHGKDSPESLRDPRGFAIKFKSEKDGIWDLTGNNLPVFFIRDHIKFPDMVHSLKPDPITNVQEPRRFFDFFASMGGMATHMLTYLYSDLGIPKNYRSMDGHGVHAYKMVNATKHIKYVKFGWFSRQGVKNLTVDEAMKVQSMDFSHASRDLYAAVEKGDIPEWDLKVQIMDPEQLDDFMFDPLDATKEWPEDQFPFKPLGRLRLDRIPTNFHLFSEQSAFCPGNFLPGMIEPSEDKLLQGRLISYHETQVHRLGSSGFMSLPVNRPKGKVFNYNQNGVMTWAHNWEGSVNYEPSIEKGNYKEDARREMSTMKMCGSYTQQSIKKELNFKQAGERYRRFDEAQRTNLVKNLAGDLKKVESQKVRDIMCSHFYKADEEYGRRVGEMVNCDMDKMMQMAESLKD